MQRPTDRPISSVDKGAGQAVKWAAHSATPARFRVPKSAVDMASFARTPNGLHRPNDAAVAKMASYSDALRWEPRLAGTIKGISMARITIEDCLDTVPNRFALVIMAAKRARQLADGATPTIESKNKECVTSLREAADGRIRFTRQVLPLIERHVRD